MTSTLSAADLWSGLAAVRKHSPLVHCITNLVVISVRQGPGHGQTND